MTYIDYKLYTCLISPVSLENKSLLIPQFQHNLWLPVDLQRLWEEGLMAGLASWLLTKLLLRSKQFIIWLILDILGLIAIFTTAAFADVALQTSIQTQNFIQN